MSGSGGALPGSPVEGPLTGRTALVTGGGNGLGAAIARALHAHGANVVVVGRRTKALKSVCSELGTRATWQQCDIADPSSVAALASSLETTDISILVNNAGIAGPVAPLTDISVEEWDEVFGVNVRGVFLMCRALLPAMVARGGGDVINLASVSGKRPLAHRAPYAASKMAVIGLTSTLAFEVGPAGVNVNSLSPGPVSGPRMERNLTLEAQRTGSSYAEAEHAFVSRAALGRMVTEAEVGAAVVAMLAMPGMCGADIDLGWDGGVNTLKQRLRDGHRLIGVLVRLPAEDLVEMAAISGFDFVVIDSEHGPNEVTDLRRHIVLAKVHHVPVLVRVGSDEPALTLRALDQGAAGIIAPHIDTPAQAEALVDAVHYPPLGHRGFATYTRVGDFGLADPAQHQARMLAETLVVGMIESPDGVRQTPNILAVPGLDAIMIGTADLRAASTPADPTPAEAIRTVNDLLATQGCWRMDIVASRPAATAAFNHGAQLVVYNLAASLMTHLADLRSAQC